MVGLQKYGSVSEAGYDTFMPVNVTSEKIYPNAFVYDDLEGAYQVNTPQLNSISVWGLLSHFLNHPINDMYVALKPITSNGVTKIVPTLVARQNPFSSDAENSLPVTRFSELPRWRLPAAAVYSGNFSRSNAARINYATVLSTGGNVTDQA